jgi:hypothetical protein
MLQPLQREYLAISEEQVRIGYFMECCYLTADTCKEVVKAKVPFPLFYFFNKNTCGQDK